MKYAIIKVINGSYIIHAEGITDIASAKVQFHDVCKILWSAPDVESACVMISDETLNFVDGCKEFIHHGEEQNEEV